MTNLKQVNAVNPVDAMISGWIQCFGFMLLVYGAVNSSILALLASMGVIAMTCYDSAVNSVPNLYYPTVLVFGAWSFPRLTGIVTYLGKSRIAIGLTEVYHDLLERNPGKPPADQTLPFVPLNLRSGLGATIQVSPTVPVKS